MNTEMAYFLGLVCGNGEVQRGNTQTCISIEIPHKKLVTEHSGDVQVYVKASIVDIRSIIEPLTNSHLKLNQRSYVTILSLTKQNSSYIIRESLHFIGNATSHENVRIHPDVFQFSRDEKIQFLKGLADVTGYIRKSNYFFNKSHHRVYLEIPHNWNLVIDICNLLKSIDMPVQNIDWAHPNMRDGNLVKHNQGNLSFWKKEHQIKIWANEFLPIGFAVLHKKEALEDFANELIHSFDMVGKSAKENTHRFYWQTRSSLRIKTIHPAENDDFIPSAIRGKHYDSWKEIAKDLGYDENS